jgi:uncharacterized protein (DUF952 family)
VTILHLVSADAWEAAADDDRYAPPSLTAEGFIHCTGDAETLLAVANALYRDAVGEMLVLEIDEQQLSAEVRWEPATPAPPPAVGYDVQFPHVYGPIDRSAVVGVRAMRRSDDGAYLAVPATTRAASPSARRTRRA